MCIHTYVEMESGVRRKVANASYSNQIICMRKQVTTPDTMLMVFTNSGNTLVSSSIVRS